jgi:hypothetical protein
MDGIVNKDLQERYDASLEIHRRILTLYPKVATKGALFRDLQVVSSRIPRPTVGGPRGVDTDRVFCALAIRAAATKDSVALLCEAGHGESAMALARVLLENAMLMAWQRLGRGRERLETYVLFVSALRERNVRTMTELRAALPHVFDGREPVESDPRHRATADAVFGDDHTWAWFPNDAGTLTKTSIAQMFRDVMERVDRRAVTVEYDLMYHLGSQEIHSGPYALSYLLAGLKDSQAFFLEPRHAESSRVIALAISNIAMLAVLNTVDDYVGLDMEKDLQAIIRANHAIGELAGHDSVE